VGARRNLMVRSAVLGAVGAGVVGAVHHWRVGSVGSPAVGAHGHGHVMGASFVDGR